MTRKTKNQRTHARRRAAERYGINLGRNTHDEWVRKIQSGDIKQAKCLEKTSNRTSIFELEHEGEKIRVVYDRSRKQIATIFPRNDIRFAENKPPPTPKATA